MQVPTIKIDNPKGKGFVNINEADFDPKTHKKFEEKEAKDEVAEEVEETKEVKPKGRKAK